MSRTIYRAWDTQENKMIDDFTNYAGMVARETMENAWNQDRYIREMFTELEYNFHKYFEHDVCEMDIPVSLNSRKKETVRGFIEFMYGSFFLNEIGGKGRRWVFADIATMAINSNAKVIYLGNSHDNPELLEV